LFTTSCHHNRRRGAAEGWSTPRICSSRNWRAAALHTIRRDPAERSIANTSKRTRRWSGGFQPVMVGRADGRGHDREFYAIEGSANEVHHGVRFATRPWSRRPVLSHRYNQRSIFWPDKAVIW